MMSNTHTSGKGVWVFALVGCMGDWLDWGIVVRE